MKKLLVWAMTVIAVTVMLTGCNSEQKAVQETTEKFLQALVDSDLDVLAECSTPELMQSDEMKLLDKENLANSFYEAIGVEKENLSEEAVKAVDIYVDRVVDSVYKDYKVGDIKIQGDTASVTTEITLGFDPNEESSLSDSTMEEIEKYRTEHYDELVDLYVEQGEKALYQKIYDDLIPIIVTKMEEELAGSNDTVESTILTLKKIDGVWKVTELLETAETSAEGETK